MILILSLCLTIGLALIATSLFVWPRKWLSPLAQIFEDARRQINTPTHWHRGGLTPQGKNGIGLTHLPHDLTGAVVANDPNAYDLSRESIYNLDSIQHLRRIAYERHGMTPEAVNDGLGYDSAIALLTAARDAAD